MRIPSALLPLLVALLATACGGEDAGQTGGGGDGGRAEGPAAKGSSNPIASLTAERLDAYLEVLEQGGDDAARAAMEKGWKITDWVRTHAAIRGVVRAGGIAPYLERIRGKAADAETKVAEMEARVADAPDNQKKFLEQSIRSMRTALRGWRNTLSQENGMEAGGALLESRMDELKAALER